MMTAPMSSKAFKLAVDIFHFEFMKMPGCLLADHHPVEGRILADCGLLTEGEIATHVPNRHTYEGDVIEPEWNEETRTYQYFSFDDGYWVDVPEEDMKTYNLDVDRLLRLIRDMAEVSGEPKAMCGELLWSLGTFWLGKRKATLFLARNLHLMHCFDEVYDVLKRFGNKAPGVVLTRNLPESRHIELPNGYRMVSLKDIWIVENDLCHFDLEILKAPFAGEKSTASDPPLVQYARDYSTIKVNGREFVFTGMKQQQLIGFLVEAWRRGEPKCRTQILLENVQASDFSNTLSKFFSGRSDWKELIGYGNGYCWLKA
ncbi:MAG: hypothetical protein HQL56_19040 [Magnetococcales bacterium]|nr:hypothetical protein [Magnetococcales bacterium]